MTKFHSDEFVRMGFWYIHSIRSLLHPRYDTFSQSQNLNMSNYGVDFAMVFVACGR